jgi:hypothetical protein
VCLIVVSSHLHDDLDALLNAKQSQQGQGIHSALTPALIDQVLNRLERALGTSGHRTTTAVALILDPVSFDVVDPSGDAVDFNPPTDMGNIDLTVNDVPPTRWGRRWCWVRIRGM